MSNLRDVLGKLVELKRITDGGLGAEPPAAGSYGGLNFVEKKAILMPFDLISHLFRVI